MPIDGKAKGLEQYHGITAGTVSASKAVIANATKDVSGIRNLTITGTLTTGSNALSSSELGVLDTVTPGTVTASKAVVVGASRQIATLGAVTLDGTLTFSAGGQIDSDSGTATASGTGTTGSVTINKMAGVVTTTTMTSVSGGGTYVLTVNNSTVAATDIVLVTMTSASAGTPILQYVTPASGSFTVTISNTNFAVNLNATATVSFLVIKA